MPHLHTLFFLVLVILFSTGCSGSLSSAQPSQDVISQFQAIENGDSPATVWDHGYTTISNESRLDLFIPHLPRETGGIYVGVGSVQNFTLAAWMRPQFILLMDFTGIVSLANRIHLAFFREAETKEAYLALWERENDAKAKEVLKKEFENQSDYTQILRTFGIARNYFSVYVKGMKRATEKYSYTIYYQDDESYLWLRRMALQGTMRAVKGNLIGTVTLQQLADFSTRNNIPVTALYTSNAEEYKLFWPFPEQYRKNIYAMPTNEKSVMIRTVSFYQRQFPWAEGSDILVPLGFHYSVQKMDDFKAWLRHPESKSLMLSKMFFKAYPNGNSPHEFTWVPGPEKEEEPPQQ